MSGYFEARQAMTNIDLTGLADIAKRLIAGSLLQMFFAVIAFGGILWAVVVSSITGKVVIISIVILLALASLASSELRFYLNLIGVAFGVGCAIYALIVTFRANRAIL
jgi:hypothetical protein